MDLETNRWPGGSAGLEAFAFHMWLFQPMYNIFSTGNNNTWEVIFSAKLRRRFELQQKQSPSPSSDVGAKSKQLFLLCVGIFIL